MAPIRLVQVQCRVQYTQIGSRKGECGTRAVDAVASVLEELLVEARVELGQIDAAALERWERRARVRSALRDH